MSYEVTRYGSTFEMTARGEIIRVAEPTFAPSFLERPGKPVRRLTGAAVTPRLEAGAPRPKQTHAFVIEAALERAAELCDRRQRVLPCAIRFRTRGRLTVAVALTRDGVLGMGGFDFETGVGGTWEPGGDFAVEMREELELWTGWRDVDPDTGLPPVLA